MPVTADAIPFNSTNLGYGSSVVDLVSQQNGHLWSAQYYVYTTFPIQTMSKLGANVFTTYVQCPNGLFQYARYETATGASWMMQQNVRSYHGSPLYKYDQLCTSGYYGSRHSDVVFYWQAYNGNAGTATKGYYPGVTPQPSFTDVSLSHWAYTFIEPVYQMRIMDLWAIYHNCGLLVFCPDLPVQRSEMAYFLERGIRGIPGSSENIPKGSGSVFYDVPQSYENIWTPVGWPTTNVVGFIEKLSSDGITGGCLINPLRYCPDATVTRAQMAVFMLRAEHGSSYTPPAVGSTSFSDVPANYWAAAWIQQLYNEGITGGCATSPLRYCPEQPITRAEMAVFLMRTFAP